MIVRKLARIGAVVGVVGATTFFGAPSRANHSISFDECTATKPSPTPTADPELTPPPPEPGDPTPSPEAKPERTPSPEDCMPPAGDRIWGDRSLQFHVSEGYRPTKEVRIYILSDEKGTPPANEGNELSTWPRSQDGVYSFVWDSVGATPHNGIYKVRVEADAQDPHPGGSATVSQERKNLRVDNPPEAVGAPRILATTIGSVTIEWDEATEPDVLQYTIYRATTKTGKTRPPYSAFRQVGLTTGPAFRDAVGPGFHWYTVRVTRRSVVTPKTGVSSPLSPISKSAEVKSLKQVQKDTSKGGPTVRRFIPFRQLAPPRPRSVMAGLPDAPFAYKLPYGKQTNFGTAVEGSSKEAGGGDPRGAVLPVAVGMFLVSSALAVGRMPY